MKILKINKKNITSSEFNEATKEFEDKDIKDLLYPFPRYFGQVIELSEDLTIEDLMNHISEYSESINYCFYSFLGGVKIEEYVNLMNTQPINKSFVDSIEFYWSTDINNDEYYLYGTFHGVITNKQELEKLSDIGINSFKMDYTPINEWKHCKIILDETINATAKDIDDNNQIITLRNRWTLFEFLQFFLSELTCFGTVEQQKKEIEEFDKTQEKYEKFRVDPDFATQLNKDELDFFISQITETMEDNENKISAAVEEEDYDTAKHLKQENEELKVELDKMLKRLKEIN